MWPSPFKPLSTRTANGEWVSTSILNVAASTSAASGSLGGAAGFDGNNDIRICNQTNGWAYVTFADTAANLTTATASVGIPFAPGSVEVMEVPATVQVVSVILVAGATSGNVTFIRGLGI